MEKAATERQADQIRSSREQIDREKERAEDLLYGTEMTLAQRDLGEGDLEAAGKRLAENRPATQDRPDRRGFEWYYLDRLCNLELLRLGSPDYPVTCVALSPDGRLIVTGSAVRVSSRRHDRGLGCAGPKAADELEGRRWEDRRPRLPPRGENDRVGRHD